MRYGWRMGAFIAAAAVLAVIAMQRGANGADSVEERLRAVEDQIAIEQLLMRYAAALNTDDADTHVSLFTPDATFELKRQTGEPPFSGPFEGRDALRKQWFADAVTSTADARCFGPMRHVTRSSQI